MQQFVLRNLVNIGIDSSGLIINLWADKVFVIFDYLS